MAVFDEKPRSEDRPMREGENLYSYYDSSNRPVIAGKRDGINAWASLLGETDVAELRARMMKSTHEFYTCELELAVHEIFRKEEFNIAIHPEMENGRRIDFHVESENLAAYVEVTCILDSSAELASDNRLAPVINAINDIRLLPGHSLSFTTAERGDDSPSTRRIVKKTEVWVNSVSPAPTTNFPETVIREGEWAFELTLMNSGTDKIYGRAIGGRSAGAKWLSPADDVKRKLEEKSRRYGRPELPFIIAIADFRDFNVEEEDVLEALYGEWAYCVDRVTLETIPRFLPNGFFGHSEGPQNRWISAVLVLPGQPYWTAYAKETEPVLYMNPWASNPISPSTLPFSTRWIDSEGKFRSKRGLTLRQLVLGNAHVGT